MIYPYTDWKSNVTHWWWAQWRPNKCKTMLVLWWIFQHIEVIVIDGSCKTPSIKSTTSIEGPFVNLYSIQPFNNYCQVL
jgi:hypothetical protein